MYGHHFASVYYIYKILCLPPYSHEDLDSDLDMYSWGWLAPPTQNSPSAPEYYVL